MEMRDSMGTPIPSQEPVTWFAQLSPEQSAVAMLRSMLVPANMDVLIVQVGGEGSRSRRLSITASSGS